MMTFSLNVLHYVPRETNHGVHMRKKRPGRKLGVKRYLCSVCDAKVENVKKRYCNKCSYDYIKQWRQTHPMNEHQKFKASVRHKTKMRIKRGLLIPLSCEVCGESKVEAHHDDYSKTYEVRWLCFKHHREHHKLIKYQS